ncbi:hypothetical protein D9619_012451 [Psilocybe cf. subviscida]|uniref:Uncharacterized protein n=1 Tax=Psilocybe cf. subviscida TaxID=2480587 RepID=A0A8H5ERC5_9AGAR|nr:hypothetical protein D9619_012451 [Psilocybe cf. subviscida]
MVQSYSSLVPVYVVIPWRVVSRSPEPGGLALVAWSLPCINVGIAVSLQMIGYKTVSKFATYSRERRVLKMRWRGCSKDVLHSTDVSPRLLAPRSPKRPYRHEGAPPQHPHPHLRPPETPAFPLPATPNLPSTLGPTSRTTRREPSPLVSSPPTRQGLVHFADNASYIPALRILFMPCLDQPFTRPASRSAEPEGEGV